jgi:hypothetical protein
MGRRNRRLWLRRRRNHRRNLNACPRP